jgi:RNA polymerase sigma-70 factor (ECF subfamily)
METERPAADAIDQAYREFAPFVRRQLFTLGVRTADLPDLCHEVFVVLNNQTERLDEIARVDLWLREVCRRTAAGYRRRAHNRREVLMTNADLSTTMGRSRSAQSDDPSDPFEGDDRLNVALDRLDDESRDLLALHDVGEMPLTELAKLVEHDRKTVRKRLEGARRRLGKLLDQTGDAAQRSGPEPPVTRPSEGSPDYSRELEITTLTPNLQIGLMGNVVIAIWPGIADLESIELLATEGPKLIRRCGGQIGYLSVVESTVRPPPFPARQRIVRALDAMGPHVLGYATILLGGGAWIARPIMSGLVVLSRPRFPMRFFSSIAAGSDWLCAHYARSPDGPVSSAALTDAAERLRRVPRQL